MTLTEFTNNVVDEINRDVLFNLLEEGLGEDEAFEAAYNTELSIDS